MTLTSDMQWAHRRLWHAIGITLVGLVIELSLTPHPLDIPVEHGDKYGHVLAYATLMFWYAQIYANRTVRLGFAVAFVTMAIALEFVQRLTGYRSFEIDDMAAGAFGVLVGWIAAPPRSPHVIDYVEARWPARS
jgi:VanZ family protein